MENVNEKLKALLMENGADLVGFADLRGTAVHEMLDYPFGVSIAVKYAPAALKDLEHGPTHEYYADYKKINTLLGELSRIGAEFLKSEGYSSRSFQATDEGFIPGLAHTTYLPHKTPATLSGLGWIGKCALLVTEEYGSAVRLTSILTDCALECGVPARDSNCGDCTECVAHCPGKAANGRDWTAGMSREAFYDPDACRTAARVLAVERTGIIGTFCGICIAVCPYTKKYISSFSA